MAIKARAQQTLTKIFDGSGIFSIILTNENTSIPVSDQGIALNYSATPTDVYVYSGTSLLTPVSSNPGPGQYTLTASGENITAGLISTLADHAAIGPATDYVTGKQSYSITVQASGQDFLGNPFSSQKKQVIIPLKKGDDATSYWVTSSSSVITKDTKNVITPSSTTVSALYQTGMADPVSYKGIFKVYLKTGTDFSTTPDYTSQSPESSHTVSPSTSVNDIKVELYDVTGNNLLDVQTIPVISQANGVISTSIVYTVTSTAVQPDDSAAWSNTIPSVGKGQYLWTRTTFYYTDGSNAVGYSMGASGKDGSSAPLLTLSADSQIVTFDSDGVTPLPSSQTVTLVANLQNVTGTATFTATPYAGTTAGSPITLGGSGNSRTLTVSQFGTTYDSVVVKATLGALSDTETIHKLSKGAEGADGKNGSDGAQGPKGADGRTSYVHVAYANSADGKTDFSTTVSTGKTYVGVFTDFTSTDSTNPADYTWSLIKGADGKDGSDGIQGPKGADGISTYVHFAYATSADGKTGFSTTDTTGKSYVGTLTDTTVADSTDPTKYTWSLMKGADGANGADGKNSFSGWLTNESITLQADSSGNVPSYTTATGTFLVYNGTTQVTGLTVSQANANGITVSISGMSYSVTGMSKDNGYVDLSVTTSGVTIIKRLTVAKSKAGATGANGTSVVNSTTPPSNPAEGQWWNDLSVTPNIVKVYQAGSWVPYRIDAINLVAGSVKTSNLAADVLTASNVVYKNSDGTTTNLQTFDFNGFSVSIQKAQTAADNANNAINNLAVGGRNLLLGTSVGHTGVGNNSTNGNFNAQGGIWNLAGGKKVSDLYNQYGSSGYLTISFDWVASGSTISGTFNPQWNNTPWGGLVKSAISPSSSNSSGHYENSVALSTGGYSTGNATAIMFRQDNLQGNIAISNLKLESGNQATDWTPAPEDIYSQVLSTNLVVNSEFDNTTGSYTGWHLDNPWGTIVTNQMSKNGNKITADSGAFLYPNTSQMMSHNYSSSTSWIYSDPIPIGAGQSISGSLTNANPSGSSTDVGLAMYVRAYDSNKNQISSSVYATNLKDVHGNWVVNSFSNATTPANTAYISFGLGWNNGKGYFGQPMLQANANYTGYVPGTPNSNMAIANAQSSADNAQTSADTANNNLASASQSGIRYLRFKSEGNSDNSSTHFGNISVFNTVGTDLIVGKNATTIGNPTIGGNGLGAATDGKYDTTYIDLGNVTGKEQYIVYDLGSLRYDVNKIEIGMWTKTRTYYGVKAQSSTDGNTWSTIYSGNITPNQIVGNSTTGQVVGTVVSFGMDTSTVLKLTADNYTIGIDANGNLVSGLTGNAQSLSLKGATIYLDSKAVFAEDFVTRLLTAQDATIGNTLTIGTGGSIQSVLGGSIWDFTPNSSYYLVDNSNPWFQVSQTGTFTMNSLGDLEFVGTITAPDKGKLPDGSTPYAYPTQTTDGNTTVTWTNKLSTTTSLGIQGLRVDQQNYNRPESSGGFLYATGHGIFMGMDQVNPRGVMTPDGNLYIDTINLNGGYSWKTTQVPTAVSKIYQGVFNGTGNMYLDAAGYVRIANALGNSGGKIYVNSGGVELFSSTSTMVAQAGRNGNGWFYYTAQKMGSGGSAVKMASDGAFFAQTSATKYKTNIEYDTTSKLADRLMTLDLASWNDKGEEDMRVAYKNYGDEPGYAIDLDGARYVGLIAEDLVKANLEEFVVRDPRDGTVESIEYDKIGIALIPAVRQQREMINDLRLEVERLKDRINE